MLEDFCGLPSLLTSLFVLPFTVDIINSFQLVSSGCRSVWIVTFPLKQYEVGDADVDGVVDGNNDVVGGIDVDGCTDGLGDNVVIGMEKIVVSLNSKSLP